MIRLSFFYSTVCVNPINLTAQHNPSKYRTTAKKERTQRWTKSGQEKNVLPVSHQILPHEFWLSLPLPIPPHSFSHTHTSPSTLFLAVLYKECFGPFAAPLPPHSSCTLPLLVGNLDVPCTCMQRSAGMVPRPTLS